jgi:hypothetical protein
MSSCTAQQTLSVVAGYMITWRSDIEDPPHTRQSLLILAAFRPWGGSQDERRAGGRAASLREPRVGRCWMTARILSPGGFA